MLSRGYTWFVNKRALIFWFFVEPFLPIHAQVRYFHNRKHVQGILFRLFLVSFWFSLVLVSAVNCAQRGWVNVDVDTIACEACGLCIFFSTPSSWTQHQGIYSYLSLFFLCRKNKITSIISFSILSLCSKNKLK